MMVLPISGSFLSLATDSLIIKNSAPLLMFSSHQQHEKKKHRNQKKTSQMLNSEKNV